jgi:hypothetical protein
MDEKYGAAEITGRQQMEQQCKHENLTHSSPVYSRRIT